MKDVQTGKLRVQLLLFKHEAHLLLHQLDCFGLIRHLRNVMQILVQLPLNLHFVEVPELVFDFADGLVRDLRLVIFHVFRKHGVEYKLGNVIVVGQVRESVHDLTRL